MKNTEKSDFREGLSIRNSEPTDHPRIVNAIKNWWDGRDLTSMLPRLFLEHFCNTSFVIEDIEKELIAFLVGFMSQSLANEAYIHFVGVHPKYRGSGLGKYLYHRFFQICREKKRSIVRACTSPVNKGSIQFHEKMGFQIEPGDGRVEKIPVTLDYNRPGDPKVLFVKTL